MFESLCLVSEKLITDVEVQPEMSLNPDPCL